MKNRYMYCFLIITIVVMLSLLIDCKNRHRDLYLAMELRGASRDLSMIINFNDKRKEDEFRDSLSRAYIKSSIYAYENLSKELYKSERIYNRKELFDPDFEREILEILIIKLKERNEAYGMEHLLSDL